MPILFYLYSSISLTLSYWSHRPVHVWGGLILFHLIYCALWDSANASADLTTAALWKPLALIMGCTVGGGMAFVLRSPRLFSPWQPWWYVLSVLGLGLLQLGSWLCWQLAPLAWWNETFLGWVLQLVVLGVSFLVLPHDAMWHGRPGTSVLVHYHFFVLSMLLTNVPYLVGPLVNNSFWHLWYGVIAGAAGLCWLLVHHFSAYDKPPRRIALVATEAPLTVPPWEQIYV